MRAVLFAFTVAGRQTARRIATILRTDGWETELRAPAKLEDAEFAAYRGGLPEFVGTVFDREALVFVGAAGIAVRGIAPHVASKRSDPAVLCVDEKAGFVIPILSGHIGGANRLARRLAQALDAVPVITTATDVNGRFSVDTWATENGLVITSMPTAKRVSAEILRRDLPMFVDGGETRGELPDGVISGDKGDLGICVSFRDLSPFDETLLLVPKALRVGLGCRRGTPEANIQKAIEQVFQTNALRVEAVAGAASIDVKADEEGLLACCRAYGWPVAFYSAETLNAVPGTFSKSEFVRNTVGVDNVCERAAAATGGSIIVPKTAIDGVTVAVAALKWGIGFGEDSRGGHRPG